MGSGDDFKMRNFIVYTIHLIYSEIKSRRLRWPGHLARMEEGRSAFNILTGKITGNRPLGRPRCRWEVNIRMNLKEIVVNTRNWVNSAQDRNSWSVLVPFDLI